MFLSRLIFILRFKSNSHNIFGKGFRNFSVLIIDGCLHDDLTEKGFILVVSTEEQFFIDISEKSCQAECFGSSDFDIIWLSSD